MIDEVTILTEDVKFTPVTLLIYWPFLSGDTGLPCTSAKSSFASPMVKPINTSVCSKPSVNVFPAAAPVTVNASFAISAVCT